MMEDLTNLYYRNAYMTIRDNTYKFTYKDFLIEQNNFIDSEYYEEGLTCEEVCIKHVDALINEIREQERKQAELDKLPTQEEILAEILLGQAEILANQSVQDKVLAEVLLNSLEV